MDRYFAHEAVAAAKKDALKRYPEESCGAIIDGVYVPFANLAADPATHVKNDPSCGCRLCSFKMDNGLLRDASDGKIIDAIIHSHPDGPHFPSQADMEAQINTDVPWGIVVTDGHLVSEIAAWGDSLPMEPLVGRRFRHGVHDCYALIRDVFRLGKEGAAEQGIEWPYDAVELPNVPRQDAWWMNGQNLYFDYLAQAGFYPIPMSEARSGDACLMKVGKNVPTCNHAAVLSGNDLMLHHLPGEHRVSRREPPGSLARTAEMWLRFDPELLEKKREA